MLRVVYPHQFHLHEKEIETELDIGRKDKLGNGYERI